MIQARYQLLVTSSEAFLCGQRKLGPLFGLNVEKATTQGQLVYDELVNSIVRNLLSRHDNSFVFDGYPCRLGQTRALSAMLAERETTLDEARETPELRLLEYVDKTKPVVGNYREFGSLRRFDAESTPGTVFGSVMQIVEGA